jgi:hypothetical protein
MAFPTVDGGCDGCMTWCGGDHRSAGLNDTGNAFANAGRLNPPPHEVLPQIGSR